MISPGGAPRRRARSVEPADWTHLRLTDRIKPRVRVLFVGINPGVRSALTGHHFAGYSNRFWKLLFESGLVPTPITFEQDDRLPGFGFGITNLVARPSPGIDDLTPAEYVEGWAILRGKIKRYRPQIVALVGVTLYRAIVPLVIRSQGGWRRRRTRPEGRGHEISPHQAGTAGGGGARGARVRAAESERPQRQLHVRRDARRVQGFAAGAGEAPFQLSWLPPLGESRALRASFRLKAEATNSFSWLPALAGRAAARTFHLKAEATNSFSWLPALAGRAAARTFRLKAEATNSFSWLPALAGRAAARTFRLKAKATSIER